MRLSLGFRSVTFARNVGSDHLPRSAAPSGLARWMASTCAGVSLRSFSGYIRWPSLSLSHQMLPRKLLVTVVPGWW